MSKNNVEIILRNQVSVILDLITSIDFLQNFPEYLQFIEDKEPKYLWFIHNAIRDNSIIKLTQLFHGKESYSFNKMRVELKKHPNVNESDVIHFDKILKPGNKLFTQLNILKIRNEHVGHILPKRSFASIDWKLAHELVVLATKLHDSVSQNIAGTTSLWLFDKEILNEIYNNDWQSRETFKLWRQMHHNNQNNISRDELEKLITLKWSRSD